MSDTYNGPRVNDGPFRYLGVMDDVQLTPASFVIPANIVPLASLAQAKRYLEDAYIGFVSRYAMSTYVDLNGQDTGELPGGLSNAVTLTLYRLDTVAHNLDTARMLWSLIRDAGDWYPDYTLSINSRGGIRQERA